MKVTLRDDYNFLIAEEGDAEIVSKVCGLALIDDVYVKERKICKVPTDEAKHYIDILKGAGIDVDVHNDLCDMFGFELIHNPDYKWRYTEDSSDYTQERSVLFESGVDARRYLVQQYKKYNAKLPLPRDIQRIKPNHFHIACENGEYVYGKCSFLSCGENINLVSAE
jgi:hypothetical protein